VASRLLGGKGRLGLRGGRRPVLLTVVARQSMGKGVSIAIVEAAGSTYLLGVTNHQVTRLDQLDPAAVSEQPADDVAIVGTSAGSRRRSPGPSASGFLRQLQERSVRR